MSPVAPAVAALAGLVLLLAPGIVLLSLLPRRDREALLPDEAAYLAVGTSVAISAWVGVLLAEVGRFSLPAAGAVVTGASLVAVVFGWRRLGWPFERPVRLRRLWPAALVLALAVTLTARPNQQIVGGRVAGAEVASMALVARTGGLDGPRLPGTEVFPLFPVVGAYLYQALGLAGALRTAALLATLGILGVIFLVRRLFGPPAALLAGLLLGLNVLQVWCGRSPIPESLSELLLFLGLVAFAHWEERGSPAFGALAGGVLGLSLLARLDNVLILVPLGIVLLARSLRRTPRGSTATPVVVAFLLLAFHAALHGLGFAPGQLPEAWTQRLWPDVHDFLRLGWMLGTSGLVLGGLGWLWAIRSRQPHLLLPLLTTVALSGLWTLAPLPGDEYPWALRRFLPVAVPSLLALAAVLLVRLAGGGRLRRGLATMLTLGLLALYVRDTRLVVGRVDWLGVDRFIADLARPLGPRDVVVFERGEASDLLALPLHALHGAHVLELSSGHPRRDRLSHLAKAWRRRYRNVYLVHADAAGRCGLFLEPVGAPRLFWFSEWSARGARPGPVEFHPLRFRLSRVVLPSELRVPALPVVDIGGSDEIQLAGFYDKEGGSARSYRWTGPCAAVYLPGARGGRAVAITAAAEQRPDVTTASFSLSGVPLGSVSVGPAWQRYVLPLPTERPTGEPVLEIDVPTWCPKDVLAGSDDDRRLGIMVDRIEVVPAGTARLGGLQSATQRSRR